MNISKFVITLVFILANISYVQAQDSTGAETGNFEGNIRFAIDEARSIINSTDFQRWDDAYFRDLGVINDYKRLLKWLEEGDLSESAKTETLEILRDSQNEITRAALSISGKGAAFLDKIKSSKLPSIMGDINSPLKGEISNLNISEFSGTEVSLLSQTRISHGDVEKKIQEYKSSNNSPVVIYQYNVTVINNAVEQKLDEEEIISSKTADAIFNLGFGIVMIGVDTLAVGTIGQLYAGASIGVGLSSAVDGVKSIIGRE